MGLILFADDSTLYLTDDDLTEIKILVSDDLKTLDRWFNINKLVVNTDCPNSWGKEKSTELGSQKIERKIAEKGGVHKILWDEYCSVTATV